MSFPPELGMKPRALAHATIDVTPPILEVLGMCLITWNFLGVYLLILKFQRANTSHPEDVSLDWYKKTLFSNIWPMLPMYKPPMKWMMSISNVFFWRCWGVSLAFSESSKLIHLSWNFIIFLPWPLRSSWDPQVCTCKYALTLEENSLWWDTLNHSTLNDDLGGGSQVW